MSNKLKIGLFIDTFYPMIDGVVTVVDNYAKRLSKYADVTVFAPSTQKKPFDDSVFSYKVVRCKSAKIPFFDYTIPKPKSDKKFMTELKNAKLDIVHIHSPFFLGKVGVAYAKEHNIPVIGTMHSQYRLDFERYVKIKPLANMLLKKILKVYDDCDETWTVNQAMANLYYYDYHTKRLPKVMHNATDMLPVENAELCKKKIKEIYGIKDDEKILLFIGRINIIKNLLFLVDSLKVLKEKYGFKFKMLFVGSGNDEKIVSEKIEKDGLKDYCVLCGRREKKEELAEFYASADLFLFPSLYDASSIVQIEAASQGTPALFIEGAATASTVISDVNGYTSENDVGKFAEKIVQIFSDEAHYREVSDNARKDLYISWDDNVERVFKLYKELIDENNSKRQG